VKDESRRFLSQGNLQGVFKNRPAIGRFTISFMLLPQ
jgi:hypothetical protein